MALVGGSPGTAGDRQEWYWYTPYGSLQIMAGDGSPRAGSYHDWRSFFQSGRLDSSTGLYVFGLRDYDPATGLWMERDHIGLAAQDPNLYRFVGNNPVTWIDPTGMQGWFGWVADTTNVAGSAAAGFRMGLLQGGANVLNDVTDIGVSTVNIIPGAWNYTVGFIPGAPQAGYLPTPDWSSNLATSESPTEHAVSRGIGSFGLGVGSVVVGGAGIAKGAASAGKGMAGIVLMADGGLAVASGSAGMVFEGTVTAGASAAFYFGSSAAASQNAGWMFSTTGNPAEGNCPRGGIYIHRDPSTGKVMRTGRTNDFARRELEHARDPALRDYTFEPVHPTDVYAEQRGLEQLLHETCQPPLNKIGGISPRNPRLSDYLEAAQRFLRNLPGGS